IVTWTDDLDATSKASETVQFSYRGTSYSIDLSKKNASTFDKAIQTYIDHARKDRATPKAARRTPGSTGSGRSRSDLDAIRTWANESGHKVADRGRIAASVVEAYDAAH
ncbi:MAG: protein lsr2, partial [Pseudonocardiales bacterium]|nr:protein lsr2 [Pseudonocardiales bacterium]